MVDDTLRNEGEPSPSPDGEGSLALALLAIAETFLISAPTLVEATFHRATREVCERRLKGWAKRLMREAQIDLRVEGHEHLAPLDAGETFVLMSNHQSLYDIPCLFAAFPGCMRMVAKTELYRIPVFAGALRASEFIEIDRKNRERALASLEVAKGRLRGGVNVWIAPEGTRSRTGRMGPFKKGGFMLALETQTRILPVTVVGSRNVLPAHGRRARRGQTVTVKFHAAIDPAEYGLERRAELMEEVRVSIDGGLPAALRGGAASEGARGEGLLATETPRARPLSREGEGGG